MSSVPVPGNQEDSDPFSLRQTWRDLKAPRGGIMKLALPIPATLGKLQPAECDRPVPRPLAPEDAHGDLYRVGILCCHWWVMSV
ncbi:hypothetical protein H671_8g19518 [Cricetulus griseus]|nr:hypothetical protein H671_8g19518 [Cricetulus griseus]